MQDKMDLRFDDCDDAPYTSGSQIARVLSEGWAERNLYCAACISDRLDRTPNSWRAVDLICPSCGEGYQLKSGKTLPKRRIVDSGYDAMISALRSDSVPNLLYMHYSLSLGVRDLLLVPRFFFTEACVERRKPLAPTARRAGWVGCNIRVDFIAPEGKIVIVGGSAAESVPKVRARYARLRSLKDRPLEARGWTLDVLELLHRHQLREFTTLQAYMLENELAQRYPNNRHVKEKIRQQLQVLRAMGVLEFLGRGSYRLL